MSDKLTCEDVGCPCNEPAYKEGYEAGFAKGELCGKDSPMGEEAFEETRFVTDAGTVIVRGGYGREDLWLGLSPGINHDDNPDVVVRVGPELQRRIAVAILEMGSDGEG